MFVQGIPPGCGDIAGDFGSWLADCVVVKNAESLGKTLRSAYLNLLLLSLTPG
jgi:hypothetical protein